MAVHFNPLTAGRMRESPEGPVLVLRSFAPGRSYRKFDLARHAHPELFDYLAAWLRHEAPDEAPGLPALLRAHAATSGLLISDQEFAAIPADAKPEYGPGHSLAAALCPEVSPLFRQDLAVQRVPANLAQSLSMQGYAALPALFDGPSLAALRQWYRTLGAGWTNIDKVQTGRKVIHDDPVGRRVLDALVPTIAALAGRAVKPSYCFAAEYRGGDDLPRHTDRAQCEYTLSLFIEHRPGDPVAPCPWPLVIHAPEGDIVLNQPAGGGPLFRGRTLPHSRPALPAECSAQMLFLHYVHADFAGPLA